MSFPKSFLMAVKGTKDLTNQDTINVNHLFAGGNGKRFTLFFIIDVAN